MGTLMKRAVTIAVLLSALAVLFKLALKPAEMAGQPDDSRAAFTSGTSGGNGPRQAGSDTTSRLLEKYSTALAQDRDLVARVADRFGRNAQAIDQTDGLRGLKLLDRLDIEAIFLYEKHPGEFRQLRDLLGTEAAADLLLHWREYFGMKHADDAGRGMLIAEITKLTPAQQKIAARYPAILPLVLADPRGMSRLVDRMKGDQAALADALAVLCFMSLEQGPADLQKALRTLEVHDRLALEAFRKQGPDGFALVSLYGPILAALGDAVPLDDSLILIRVNAPFIDQLLESHRSETVAGHIRHAAAAGLIESVAGSPDALRLIVEFGQNGELALKRAGPDAADVVFADFFDPLLRRQAVRAIAEHGSMALAVLDKYASDPDFQEILRAQGAAVIPPIARSDSGPETLAHLGGKRKRTVTESLALAALFASGDNGQATIRTIKNDGLERVAQLDQTAVEYYQFLPLYDVIHLGNVLRKGYAPTLGETTWALVDGCFVITDALSLAALQPEGVVAAEAIRSEVKVAVREGAKTVSRDLVSGGESAGKALMRHEVAAALAQGASQGGSAASRRFARWWSVRSAGGLYQVFKRLPEALPRLSLSQVTELAAPLAKKAGLRLSSWRAVRLIKDGVEIALRIPPERGLKYVAAQAVQAGVGVVGIHKMEEYLKSSRMERKSRRSGPVKKHQPTPDGDGDNDLSPLSDPIAVRQRSAARSGVQEVSFHSAPVARTFGPDCLRTRLRRRREKDARRPCRLGRGEGPARVSRR